MTELPHPPDQLAKVLPFRRRRSPESLEPESLSDSEIIDFALTRWRHPAIPSHSIAEHIARVELEETDNAWTNRLKDALSRMYIPDELYDQLSDEHPAFQDMQLFLRETQTRSDQEKLAYERKATLILMDIYGASQLDQSGKIHADDVAQLFRKMIRGIGHPSESS